MHYEAAVSLLILIICLCDIVLTHKRHSINVYPLNKLFVFSKHNLFNQHICSFLFLGKGKQKKWHGKYDDSCEHTTNAPEDSEVQSQQTLSYRGSIYEIPVDSLSNAYA